MVCSRVSRPRSFVAAGLLAAGMGGCATTPMQTARETNDRLCLARVMYFESLRSSDDGMLAVGTVVMNRLESGRYPHTICGVVGQANQFAPGALTLPFNGPGRERALRVADEVLAGKRYPGLEHVMFFHTAGYSFPYHNMHYVAVAGGNAFYYKTNDRDPSPGDLPGPPGPQYAFQSDYRTASAAALADSRPTPAPEQDNTTTVAAYVPEPPRPIRAPRPQPVPALAYEAPAAEPPPRPSPFIENEADGSSRATEPNFQSLY